MHAVSRISQAKLASCRLGQTCAANAQVKGTNADHAPNLLAWPTTSLPQLSRWTSSPHSHTISSASITLNPLQAVRTAAHVSSFARRLQSAAQPNAGALARPSLPVNPPSTTLPAAIDFPIRPNNEDNTVSRFKYYFALGRAYLGFYKTGVKNVWLNHKLAKEIAQRLKIKPYAGGNATRRSHLQKLSSRSSLSRADFQLLERTRADVKKLPLFGLIIAICGEFTPLVVLATGKAVVPRTCQIPSQVEKHDHAVLQHQRQFYHTQDLEMPPDWVLYATSAAVKHNMTPQAVMHLSVALGLVREERRWVIMSGYIGNLAMKLWYRPRLADRLAYLELDDQLLRSSLGRSAAGSLSTEELKIAANERGIIWVPRSNSVIFHNLEKWLSARSKARNDHIKVERLERTKATQ